MGRSAVIDQAQCSNCGSDKLYSSSGRFNAETGEYLDDGDNPNKLTVQGLGAIVVSAIFGALAYAPIFGGGTDWDYLTRMFLLLVAGIFSLSGVGAVVLNRVWGQRQVVYGISHSCRRCGYRWFRVFQEADAR